MNQLISFQVSDLLFNCAQIVFNRRNNHNFAVFIKRTQHHSTQQGNKCGEVDCTQINKANIRIEFIAQDSLHYLRFVLTPPYLKWTGFHVLNIIQTSKNNQFEER